MKNWPLCFQRPNISFTNENKQDVHSIPELIEFNAKFNAKHTFCIQAEKALLQDSPSFLRISYAELKHAICHCAEWLKSSVQELVLPELTEDGAASRKGPPIALLLDSDINLLVHMYTLMSLGVRMLLLSPRLSPAAAQHLLSETSTRALIHTARLAYKAKEISLTSHKQDDEQVRLYAANDYHFWFNSTNGDIGTDQSICQSGYDGGDDDRNVLILHSSGTTGLPKPIYASHKQLLTFVTCHAFRSEESAQRLNLSTLPLYHGYGLVTPALSLGIGKTFCIPISSVNPTAASVLQLIDSVHARCLMSVPSILEEIILLSDATGLQKLTQLDFVAFGGGNMKPAIGNSLVSAGVNLINHFGTTEAGPLAPVFIPGPDYEWQYFRLRRDIQVQIMPTSTSNDGDQLVKLITYPIGWHTPFEIQDQIATSPGNPMVDFKAIGRKDSVIVLATGEKVQPTIIETMLSEHSLVKAAIAFGDGHFQLGVVVQHSNATTSDLYNEFKMTIWPTVLAEYFVYSDRNSHGTPMVVVVTVVVYS